MKVFDLGIAGEEWKKPAALVSLFQSGDSDYYDHWILNDRIDGDDDANDDPEDDDDRDENLLQASHVRR